MSMQADTIAAVATPAGPGAIGILRLSGPAAAEIAAAVFRPLGRAGLLERPEPVEPRELIPSFSWEKIPREDILVPKGLFEK